MVCSGPGSPFWVLAAAWPGPEVRKPPPGFPRLGDRTLRVMLVGRSSVPRDDCTRRPEAIVDAEFDDVERLVDLEIPTGVTALRKPQSETGITNTAHQRDILVSQIQVVVLDLGRP